MHDVYVCVYMHSHVSYGVDMEIEGQLKGVVSLLQPFEAVWWKVPLTSEPFYQPPCATVCTEKVKGTDSCRVPYDWRDGFTAGVYSCWGILGLHGGTHSVAQNSILTAFQPVTFCVVGRRWTLPFSVPCYL